MPFGQPQVLVLAGPNGAGKTTFAREYLTHEADCPVFIDAVIAAGLSPFAPERAAVRAGRLMLELMRDAERRSESFAFETTLAARNYARTIPRWRAASYRVSLHSYHCLRRRLRLPELQNVCGRAGMEFRRKPSGAGSSLDCRTSSASTSPS
jgi:predicted ABC-type ATPase